MMRDDAIEFEKIPSLYRDPRRVIHPGFDVSWVVPVNKRFGFSIAAGASTHNYTPARNTVDVLGEYTVWRRFALFANLRNVGDEPNRGTTSGPSTPGHARLRSLERYGSLWTFGVKGTF